MFEKAANVQKKTERLWMYDIDLESKISKIPSKM